MTSASADQQARDRADAALPADLATFRQDLTSGKYVTNLGTAERVHIITQTRLRHFSKVHPNADGPLRAWETIVRARKYKTPHDVKTDFGSVDFLKDGRVVFNIGGNKFRLVAKILYRSGKVLIRHVLTHEEYDRLSTNGLL